MLCRVRQNHKYIRCIYDTLAGTSPKIMRTRVELARTINIFGVYTVLWQGTSPKIMCTRVELARTINIYGVYTVLWQGTSPKIMCTHVGLARTIYIYGMYGFFGREITKIYGHTRCIYTVLANPIHMRCTYTVLASPNVYTHLQSATNPPARTSPKILYTYAVYIYGSGQP
jgi:hypothetical protein